MASAILPEPLSGARNLYGVPGVYKIVNSVTGSTYIGSTVNLGGRWCVHRYQLRKKTHGNSRMQKDWDLHGADAFEFISLELVDRAEALIDREQFFMDKLLPEYNLAPRAGSNAGVTLSEETKKRIGDGVRGERNAWYGKVPACVGSSKKAEVRAKISASQSGDGNSMYGVRGPMSKLKDDEVRHIRSALLSGETSQSLADIYGVSKGAIQHIKKGRSYRDVI